MSEMRRAVVKNADMSDEMQQVCLISARVTLAIFSLLV
jgi:hypothetical protein